MMRRAVLVSLVGIGLACVGDSGPRERQVLMEGGDPRGTRQALERQRDRHPRSVDVRVELGSLYYRIARDALDLRRDEDRYLIHLERAIDEFVTALEIDATDDRPHFYLAMMDLYRGESEKAERGFRNALRLEESGVQYTNLAEMYVYLGRLSEARRFNEKGWRNGAPPGAVLFNDMLIAWREGNSTGARAKFRELQARFPESLREINVARLPEPPDHFEAFAGYCCGSPACGPYLRDACADLSLAVDDHSVSKEAVLKELRLEIERTRRLRDIYEQRKVLEVEIEAEALEPSAER